MTDINDNSPVCSVPDVVVEVNDGTAANTQVRLIFIVYTVHRQLSVTGETAMRNRIHIFSSIHVVRCL